MLERTEVGELPPNEEYELTKEDTTIFECFVARIALGVACSMLIHG